MYASKCQIDSVAINLSQRVTYSLSLGYTSINNTFFFHLFFLSLFYFILLSLLLLLYVSFFT